MGTGYNIQDDPIRFEQQRKNAYEKYIGKKVRITNKRHLPTLNKFQGKIGTIINVYCFHMDSDVIFLEVECEPNLIVGALNLVDVKFLTGCTDE